MHNPAQDEAAKSGLTHEQQIRAAYSEDFMNLDDNIFGLGSDGRDLVFGRTAMSDNATNNHHHHHHYEANDNPDINNILAQMPTPVSNTIRAVPDGSGFMSPLQVDQDGGYDRMNGVAYATQGAEEMFFTPLLSPAVTPMDVLRHHDNDTIHQNIDPVYFSPLTSPALERFPPGHPNARRSQSLIGLSSLPPNRRPPDTIADGQRTPRRTAPYSPAVRATMNRKRNSIASLNLTNGSPSENSSDSVSPEPLPSSSMPPPPPRNSSSNRLYESGVTTGRRQKSSHRHKHPPPASQDVSPATPASFLNMSLQQQEDQRQQQASHGHVESTITFDHSLSSDTSPPTVKSAGSTPTFGPTVGSGAMGSPSFISIPTSFDPNSSIASTTLPPPATLRRSSKQSSKQNRSSSSSPAFKPIISPNLKPLLPGGTSSEVIQTLASKSNYQNILEGNHSQLGLSYPKELSSGIESRRTSHKVAEQARRSRINNAIDQLGSLLPGELDGNSKAITVEKAIEYIKNLEDQLAKARAELQETKK